MDKLARIELSIYSILYVLNDIRANPKKYAKILKKYFLAHTNSEHYNSFYQAMISEGKSVIKETIKYLNNLEPVGPLEVEPGLTAAAYHHGLYQKQIRDLSHVGVGDNKTVSDRINKYGTFSKMCSENLDGGVGFEGRSCSALYAVLRYVIDGGVPDRGHRLNCFNPSPTKIGISIIPDEEILCNYTVFKFAGEYENNLNKLPKDLLATSGYTQYLEDKNSSRIIARPPIKPKIPNIPKEPSNCKLSKYGINEELLELPVTIDKVLRVVNDVRAEPKKYIKFI